MREFLIFLEEIRELLLMIDEDKDFTYLAEVIGRVEEELEETRKHNEILKSKLDKYQKTLSSLTTQLE